MLRTWPILMKSSFNLYLIYIAAHWQASCCICYYAPVPYRTSSDQQIWRKKPSNTRISLNGHVTLFVHTVQCVRAMWGRPLANSCLFDCLFDCSVLFCSCDNNVCVTSVEEVVICLMKSMFRVRLLLLLTTKSSVWIPVFARHRDDLHPGIIFRFSKLIISL